MARLKPPPRLALGPAGRSCRPSTRPPNYPPKHCAWTRRPLPQVSSEPRDGRKEGMSKLYIAGRISTVPAKARGRVEEDCAGAPAAHFGTPLTRFFRGPIRSSSEGPVGAARPRAPRQPVSARPPHVSWPHTELHRRSWWRGPRASQPPISARPSRVSWHHGELRRKSHWRGPHASQPPILACPIERFVAP